jgi:hypothetical protein
MIYMTTKSQAILRDTLYILFFGLYTGWIFSFINHIIVLLVQPFLLIPLAFIRPSGVYKMKKIVGIIAILIFIIIAIATFTAYELGIKTADSTLWPFGFKLTVGLCFLIYMIIYLHKLFQDMKIPEEDGR